jgi:hypothetical protein
MRTSIATAVLLLVARNVGAQPGQTPSTPAAQPTLQPPQLELSPHDQRLLARGEISHDRWIAGGVYAVLFGFGLGQAEQGRWLERGWIFTLGETVSIAMLLDAVANPSICNAMYCHFTPQPLAVAGLVGWPLFRILGITDAFLAPPLQNAHIRELRWRLGIPQAPPAYTVAPFVAPARSLRGDTTVAGVQLGF